MRGERVAPAPALRRAAIITHTPMRLQTAAALSALVLSLGAARSARAQQAGRGPGKDAPRRTIMIRGVLPTPQVVTVRPRDVPDYDRSVLAPAFFDRHFRHTLDAPKVITTREALVLAGPPAADPRLRPRAAVAAQPQ